MISEEGDERKTVVGGRLPLSFGGTQDFGFMA